LTEKYYVLRIHDCHSSSANNVKGKLIYFMKRRFEGTDGQRRLIMALQSCHLVEHNEALANRLAEVGQLVSFEVGDTIMTQGAEDNDVYFILVGEANVLVNGRQVAIREVRDSIGEMALHNPTEPRSATINARTAVVALKVSEPDFHQVAQEHTQVWRMVAQVVAERLRQRSTLLNLPNTKPLLFLGCSVESLMIAQEIQLGLKHDNVEAMVWTDGVFGPSGVPIDGLLNTVNESDFAVFVFSPDDKVLSRENEYNAPRDNTVFELGLFMGKLERSRTFIVKEQNTDVKIPTDLLGITPLTYIYREGDKLSAAVAPVCTELRKVINNLGVR
jgi:CRP/FNR family cyclic AMP-dependent transcriptional regulator